MIMARTPQVAQITTGWEPAVPVLAVDYHQAAARRANLSRQDIATSLLTAEGGIPVGTFYEGVHRNTIYLKCTAADGSRIDNPENVPVFPMLPNVNALLDDGGGKPSDRHARQRRYHPKAGADHPPRASRTGCRHSLGRSGHSAL